METMGQIAAALGVKVSDLFESDDPAPVLTMPVSKTLQKLMAIPDDVYDAATGVSRDNDIWGDIHDLLKAAAEIEAQKKGESKDA